MSRRVEPTPILISSVFLNSNTLRCRHFALPGIAAALAEIFNGDDSEYFKKYLPNMMVYKIMLDVWWEQNEM